MFNKHNKIVLSSASSGYLLKIVQLAVSLFTLPLIISNLGKVQYGIYILVIQSVSFLSMADLGVKNSLGRFIAQEKGENYNKENIIRIVHTSFFLLLIFGFFINTFVYTIHGYIPNLLGIEQKHSSVTSYIFLLNGIFVGILFPLRIGQGILFGFQRYSTNNFLLLINPIIFVLGIYQMNRLSCLNLINITLLQILSLSITQIMTIIIGLYKSQINFFKKIIFSKSLLKKILSFGSSSLFISSSGLLVNQGLIVVVGILLGTIEAGIFGIIIMMITNISFIITKISQPIVTLSAKINSEKKISHLSNLIISSMKYSINLSVFIFISFYYQAENILKILVEENWNQDEFSIASKSLILMTAAICFGIPQFVSRASLQGLGFHWQASMMKIITSIISLILAFWLMHYGFGLYGAIVGWSFSWIFQGLVYFPNKISNVLNIKITEQIIKVYIPALSLGFLLFYVGLIINPYLDNNIIDIIFFEIILLIISLIFVFINKKLP